MERKFKSQSNSVQGKINTFNDIRAVLLHAQDQVKDESPSVAGKVLTYITQKAPKYWCSNTIALTVILCRLESQLERLSVAHEEALNVDLSDASLKRARAISLSISAIITQSNILCNRLSLQTSSLHGSGTLHVAANANSREVASLAVADLKGVNTTSNSKNSLADAKAKAKAHLEGLTE